MKNSKLKTTRPQKKNQIKLKEADTSKYCGTVKFCDDALNIRKKITRRMEINPINPIIP